MSKPSNFNIPDICRNTTVLMIFVTIEMIVLASCLVFEYETLATSFALYSFYAIWLTILTAIALCAARKRIYAMSHVKGFFFAFLLCISIFMLVELTAQYLLYRFTQQPFDLIRLVRLMLAASLTYLLLLRFFYLLGLTEFRHKSEAQSRLQALQSRINPHFLFNSLNTISELVATEPEKAETAIMSLSSLFRANLEEAKDLHPLHAEIKLCEGYLLLEKWRLEDDLSVEWHNSLCEEDQWFVPKLILQPLIENAVIHGRDVNGSVNVMIDIRQTKDYLSIMISNTNNNSERTVAGNGIAIDNIKERLFVLYDDKQLFKVKNNAERYQVIMRIPKHKQHLLATETAY